MSHTSSIIHSFQPFLQEAWKKSHFKEVTEIQKQVIPAILEGQDIIAESPTGTGKTLAYLLPTLEKIDVNKKEMQVLIFASSRELVMQILEEIRIWTEGSSIGRAALIGGANVKRQIDKLKKKPQIVVATPGRAVELMQQKKLKVHEVKTVVFDEADQLFSNEHQKQIDHVLKSTLKDRQILVFSATLNELVEEKAKIRMNDAKVVRVKLDEEANNVEHVYIICEQRDKMTTLRRLINLKGLRALAFSNDIQLLSTYAAKLEYDGMPLGLLHSETTKQEREQALRQFREKRTPLLLATDVASRGLDIKELTHVFQLDVPRDAEQYKHRAGRTGRAGQEGTVISLVTEQEVQKLLQLGKKLSLTMYEKRLYKGELV
ncbi:DEAD/DEAH box helicase [Evansella cellulosilytica]|uniref:DEAD/DEAH box helicase domain protein n=1 Tax=Evansella cellulosilytica (strain ATCC 21833 / DSM 2522 / FERM P-1141 / JCM 9156 / N-4) TaxID=649639 RepID=E6U025_EVAC2|nr:DEAD/DEAH box helicase [Evansella cellulosilytica]ADU29029.1 DEAD/DEAH box helicase domain protein [Evansella cellulosilytica DSM 2522]